jgi:hypothetical protein
MSMPDDDQTPEPALTKEQTLRRMEQERARLDADIKRTREELEKMPETPGLDRAAGDWRKADETGHNEADEARG